MVLCGRVTVCYHMLSIQTTVVSGTLWQKLALPIGVVTHNPYRHRKLQPKGARCLQLIGKGWSQGVGDGSRE